MFQNFDHRHCRSRTRSPPRRRTRHRSRSTSSPSPPPPKSRSPSVVANHHKLKKDEEEKRRFKNLTKQERSSQMQYLFLPPNFLEIRTKLQTWLLKLLCQSFQVHLPSPVLFIPSISREF
ncbi:uncharacterized protein LOC107608324 [Arachis ipaensis]|uniref:uncharacterized protein LOC107608324 n=1 Tax=Arachis ipaensis TaxID=130454 RepID=UPI000A2B32D5|nr:uncharacterized protein LOC107608324 [Arachis ipaensis]